MIKVDVESSYYIYNLFVNREVRNKFKEEGNQKLLSILIDLKKKAKTWSEDIRGFFRRKEMPTNLLDRCFPIDDCIQLTSFLRFN